MELLGLKVMSQNHLTARIQYVTSRKEMKLLTSNISPFKVAADVSLNVCIGEM